MYKIGFTLGDPSYDGHGMTEEYHILTSHSVEEIEDAYKKATEKLGWNYVKTICRDYEDSTIDIDQIEDLNIKLGIKFDYCLDDWRLKGLKHDGYCYLDSDTFVGIFFGIISSEILDFEWKEVDFDERTLPLLSRGAGYGLFAH